MTKFYCSAIHKNLRIDTDAQTKSLRILPCCAYKTTQRYSTLEQYETSDEIIALKNATDWPQGCEACRQQESQQQFSFRQHSNNSLKNVVGRRYEIMPSNVCNLRCLMCNSGTSTALAKEKYKAGIDIVNLSYEIDVAQQQLAILEQDNNIESISLIGGEFFLSKNSLEFLDFVIARNIPLRVVTNATVLLDQHFKKLQLIENLELQISIDGVHAGYEFMRYPASWSNFDSVTKEIISTLANAKINFHFVAQALNLQQLIPTMDYSNQLRRPLRVSNLIEPENLSWKILTDDEKQEIDAVVKQQLSVYRLASVQQQEVENYLRLLNTTPYSNELRQQFEHYVSAMFKQRTVDWPALKESNLHPRVRSTVFYPLK